MSYGIKNFIGTKNTFTNFFIWDLPIGATSLTINADSELNTFLGGYIPTQNYNDASTLGSFTIGNNNENLVRPSFKRLKVWDQYANKDSVNKLTVTAANVSSGTVASPAGDIAIKLGKQSTPTGASESADFTARILTRNMDASGNYGSNLYFQTHGAASNRTTYVDAMKLDYLGNATILGGITNNGVRLAETHTIKKTIGVPGISNVDFNFTSVANTTAQNLDLGAIIPAKSRVTAIELVCTQAADAADLSFTVGNASGG